MEEFSIDLDFCVISNPFNDGSKYIIFLTRRGLTRLDETVTMEDGYSNAVDLIESLGYIEFEPLTFEFKDPSNNYKNLEIEKVIKTLESNGIHYNKKLEFTIEEEFKSLKLQAGKIKDELLQPQIESELHPAVIKDKIIIPKVGEKINLFFYLFLQCYFSSDEKCIIDFNGDFFSKRNNFVKNFIHISNSDFTRIPGPDDNIIILQSVKTYADFYDETSILFGGAFEYVKPVNQGNMPNPILVTKKYSYNILDIKKNVNPQRQIVIEVEKNKYFKEMVKFSVRIEKEKKENDAKKYPIDLLIEELEGLIDILKEKMLKFGEAEEYEKSGDIKKDILAIGKKIKGLKKIKNKEITIAEYSNIFRIE